MQMYDVLTNSASTLGITFDEAYAYSVYLTFAIVGGGAYLLSLFCNVLPYVFRAIRRLLRAVLYPVRRLLKVHF